ncbi:MAG TPA: response regulator [Negativicutes bacterium]|nr:response regulator [Negativicutes bacterium]
MDEAKKVLIVEDSATVKYEVGLLLKQLGITPLPAGGELGLFGQIEQYGKLVDLIIMDLTLKHENGFELIKKLKETPKYDQIPVVILTEHADINSVLTAKKLGVAGYIRKPIKRDEFIRKIKEAMLLYEEDDLL